MLAISERTHFTFRPQTVYQNYKARTHFSKYTVQHIEHPFQTWYSFSHTVNGHLPTSHFFFQRKACLALEDQMSLSNVQIIDRTCKNIICSFFKHLMLTRLHFFLDLTCRVSKKFDTLLVYQLCPKFNHHTVKLCYNNRIALELARYNPHRTLRKKYNVHNGMETWSLIQIQITFGQSSSPFDTKYDLTAGQSLTSRIIAGCKDNQRVGSFTRSVLSFHKFKEVLLLCIIFCRGSN